MTASKKIDFRTKLRKFAIKIAISVMTKSILFQLFSSFFRIGAFTFGGGWAMISLIEREIVDLSLIHI